MTRGSILTLVLSRWGLTCVADALDHSAEGGYLTLRRWSWGRGLVLAVLLALNWTDVGLAAPGDLDPTFGSGGVSITFGPADAATALIQQADGKLVVAGRSVAQDSGRPYIFLARYRPDGHPDPSFGSGGKLTTAIGSHSLANALIQQPDGKLVVAASSLSESMGASRDVLLVRYLPDGRLDATFGVGGAVTTDFGASEEATALVLQPDGKLVLAGWLSRGGLLQTTILARYRSDGRLDDTFGAGGKVTISPVGSSNAVSALLVQADGKLVVTGSAFPPGPAAAFVARFQAEGSLDPTFGQAGTVTFAPFSRGRAIIQEPDGKLVIAGLQPSGNSIQILLARCLPDGRLDPAFGAGGIAMPPLESTGGELRALIRQPDGKFVVAGEFSTSGAMGILARYRSDGSLDPTFGAGGIVTTPVGGDVRVPTLIQQPDGKLVVAGLFSTGNETDILLARYEALGCPAVDPESCLASLAGFVTDVYLAALARTSDASETAYWVDVLTTEPSPDTVRGMFQVIFDGLEFRQRPVNPWQYVAALHQAMLGRAPSQRELDWWVQAVLDRVNTLLPEFVDSPEFRRLVPSCQDQAAVTLLVGRLVQQVLRRVASAEELAWWTQDIMTWCALEEAMETFFNSGEYLGVPRTLAGHVTVLYRALLAREPDAEGLAWWVDDLAGQLAALEDDLMVSPEFEARVYRLFP